MKKRIHKDTAVFIVFTVVASAIFITLLANVIQEQKLRNTPVDVLKDWSLHVDASVEYKQGDIVNVESKFTKLLDISGEANRYIECRNASDTGWDGRVPVSSKRADSPAGKDGRSVFTIGIPLSLGPLPSTCRVYVSVTYNVNKYHPTFQETNVSNNFRIIPRPGLTSNSNQVQTFIFTTPQMYEEQKSQAYSPGIDGGTTVYNIDPSIENGDVTNNGEQDPSVLDRLLNPIFNILPGN